MVVNVTLHLVNRRLVDVNQKLNSRYPIIKYSRLDLMLVRIVEFAMEGAVNAGVSPPQIKLAEI